MQCKLAWWANVYQLWEQRSVFLHEGKIYTEEQLIGIINKNVKGRMKSNKFNCNSVLNRVPFCRWEINYALPPIPCLEIISVELELTDSTSVYQLQSCLPNMAYVR